LAQQALRKTPGTLGVTVIPYIIGDGPAVAVVDQRKAEQIGAP
jgi:hypothetical protein